MANYNELLGNIAMVLVLVGALNWGLEALDYNLVQRLVGDDKIQQTYGTMKLLTPNERLVYGLVGVSALYIAMEKLGE